MNLVWAAVCIILALAIVYYAPEYPRPQRESRPIAWATPTFSFPGGYYDHDIQLSIKSPRPDAKVIFSMDGSVPTFTTATLYTQPLHLSVAMPVVIILRARAVLSDTELGPVVSATYFLGVPAKLPLVSLIISPSELWDPEYGLYVNPYERGIEWERSVDVTYVDQERDMGFHIAAGMRIHGGESRKFEKKPLRLYFREEYGSNRLIYSLFADSEVQAFKRLILHSGGQDWYDTPLKNWTLIRNPLAARLALDSGGYATYSQPVLLFINGEPWGIYQLRERPDEDFLADHYGIIEADFLESPGLSVQLPVIMGDRQHWDYLMNFVETHDLADPTHYAYVRTQVNIENFINYNILQIYMANSDWPHHNVHQFRPRVVGGRWHWLLWDCDQGFGMYNDVNVNFVEKLLAYNNPETQGQDTLLLRKLLANSEFRARFIERSADLLNSTLASESVNAHIDALVGELDADIIYEILRWSSTVDWRSNIQDLHTFANLRPDIVRQHIVESFDLDGTAPLTFCSPDNGTGIIMVNGTHVQDCPWQGLYFQGSSVRIRAVPSPGYRFAGWDAPSLSQNAVITHTVTGAQTFTPRFVVAENDGF